jgi:DNA-3-methyladenine glycosylase II
VLRVDLRDTIDLPASLAPLGRSGDDGIDRWDGERLVRTHSLGNGTAIPYLARPAGRLQAPALEVTASIDVTQAIRATFAPTPIGDLARLTADDPQIATLVARYPGIVPVLYRDPIVALVRSISAQQVNLRWAAIVRRRIAERYGTRHAIAGEHVYSLHAGPLAAASIDELFALQLTRAKARAVIAVGEAGVSGALDLATLAAMDDDALITHLTQIRGIGRWSAEWFIARTLGRPRVVAGDLGVRKAVGRLYLGGAMPSEEQVRRLTAHWGASASHVQVVALHDLVVSP